MSMQCPTGSKNVLGDSVGSKLCARLKSSDAVVDDVGERVAAFELLPLLKKFNFSSTGLLGFVGVWARETADWVASSCW